ncbi:hypothetical protein D778_01326 [Xanthomarina gelatinilytica]|uniref:Uncharacterized protein n=1 Tax=Xanthomarina gelatinilytica TaxID=1137281 RepID=M7MFR1_9FLAO|nr:hypothetical protein D778_01326 [Xanthomarina gelatinilytica]
MFLGYSIFGILPITAYSLNAFFIALPICIVQVVAHREPFIKFCMDIS